ncbi:MAG: class II aldolase/adducin family protein [Desulfatibacillaceae bacterium]
MENLAAKYESKLVRDNLARPGKVLFGTLDAEVAWHGETSRAADLAPLFDSLSINTVLLAEPAEPYRAIIQRLATKSLGAILPQDCETRTFLHDLPVAASVEARHTGAALAHRKGVVTTGGMIVTTGTVSPEQAYVTFSSICFACFVKFFSDCLEAAANGFLGDGEKRILRAVWSDVFEKPSCGEDVRMFRTGPFETIQAALTALEEAGRATVEDGLVDSYFGNVSCLVNDTLLISQTGSSLDELAGFVDACPMDKSSCAAITASSELPAHREIVSNTPYRAVLHGHPRFSVVLSMACEKTHCPCRGRCHVDCPEKRFVCGAPIVPGEVGGGPKSLWRTVPSAVAEHGVAVVHGHGVFAAGEKDFNQAFRALVQIEDCCREQVRMTLEKVM